MTKFHFISGLPRSGSTLLAAILRQNPTIHASMSSPVGGIFSAMQKAISGSNEAAMFLDDRQRGHLLKGIFDSCYEIMNENPYEPGLTVFDTNRVWPAKLPILTRLFPEAKFLCCVRRPASIVDSVERLIRSNPMELSGIFGFEPGGTIFSRAQGLMSPTGLVGFALDALREGYYSPLAAGRMWLIEYEALAKHPGPTINAIYDWLGLPRFAHDFANIEQIPGAQAFDRKLGTPGLHAVKPRVEWRERESVLPPTLFKSLPAPFWRVDPNPTVLFVHVDEDKPEEKPLPPDQIDAMLATAQRQLEDTANG
jgi:sulfotransferase